MRYWFLVILCCVLFFPLTVSATHSDNFWNPFRGDTTNITQEISTAIQKILDAIGSFAGKAVSAVRIPIKQTQSAYKTAVPANGNIGSGQYNLNKISFKSLTGRAPSPPSPINDVSEEGKPCGGGSGDPFWAKDCSCHCSTGAKKNTVYEATGYCPDDTNRRCEDCRDITRHDNSYTKISECLSDF